MRGPGIQLPPPHKKREAPGRFAGLARRMSVSTARTLRNGGRLLPKIRTTRKAGGLLWPCKGLLPAAPKDAGFHAVQAQCPCRLGYPLEDVRHVF